MTEAAFTIVAEGAYVTQKRKEKKTMSVDPNNTFWKEDKNKFGLKMLQKMGWTEGKGLGKNESGMTEFVKTEVRKENQGLGSDVDTSKNWFETRDAFNNMLATLNAKYSNTASSDSSDDDSSSSEDEKPTTSRPRHLISATKRHKAKMVSNYSKADIAAILGKHPAELEESSPKTSKKEKRKPAKEEIAEEENTETDKQEKKKKKKDKKHKGVVPDQEEPAVDQPVEEATEKKKKKKKKSQPDQDVNVETTEEAPAKKKRKEKHTSIEAEPEKENKKASKKPKNV